MKRTIHSFHADTFEMLTREVYIIKTSRPTMPYIVPLWLSLTYYRPRIDDFVAFLRTHMEENRQAIARAVIYEERVHYERMMRYERETIAACYIISRHLHASKGNQPYTSAFTAKTRRKSPFPTPQ